MAVAVIMAAILMVLRREHLRCGFNGVSGADGTYVVCAAVQAIQTAQPGEFAWDVTRCGPFDAGFLAAVGAVG